LIADKNFCENDDEIYNHSLRPPPLKPRETQMSDVLQTARKYHARLKSELTKVESFLQMAETFSQGDDSEDRVQFFGNGSDNTTVLKQPAPERQRPAASGAAAG
jgi:hypothetical protein